MNSILRAPAMWFAFVVVLSSAFASAQQTERPKARPEAAELERRLSEIERQVGRLLKEIQALRQEIQPQSGSVRLIVFQLRYTDTNLAIKILKDIFRHSEDAGSTLVIEEDRVTNSVVVAGPPEKLEMVKELLDKLDRKNQ